MSETRSEQERSDTQASLPGSSSTTDHPRTRFAIEGVTDHDSLEAVATLARCEGRLTSSLRRMSS